MFLSTLATTTFYFISFFNSSKLLDSSDLESDSDHEVKPKKRPNLSGDDESGSEVATKKSNNNSSDEEDSIVDSDGEARPRGGYSSDENKFGPGEDSGSSKNQSKKKGENRQSRKSKDAALKEIYSEKNRMLRESQVKAVDKLFLV